MSFLEGAPNKRFQGRRRRSAAARPEPRRWAASRMSTLSHIGFCLLVLLLHGCATKYAYTTPSTDEGEACVASCKDVESYCLDTMRKQDTTALLACTDKEAERRSLCPRPTDCPPQPCSHVSDVPYCGEIYRKCYRDCGGTVDER
jgi:hypothetical protein